MGASPWPLVGGRAGPLWGGVLVRGAGTGGLPSHLASPLLSPPAAALLIRGEAETQVSAGLGRAGHQAGEGSL